MTVRAEIGQMKRELAKLVETGQCPECGRHAHKPHVSEVDYITCGHANEDREPSGWLQQSIEDGRLVRRPYPPDLRALCGTCGERIGVLFLEAMYDEPAQPSPDTAIVQQDQSCAIPAPPAPQPPPEAPPEPSPEPAPPAGLFGRRWPWEK